MRQRLNQRAGSLLRAAAIHDFKNKVQLTSAVRLVEESTIYRHHAVVLPRRKFVPSRERTLLLVMSDGDTSRLCRLTLRNYDLEDAIGASSRNRIAINRVWQCKTAEEATSYTFRSARLNTGLFHVSLT
jgi:hypothetical protein